MNQDVTQLLLDWNNGNKEALDQLIPLVYNELHEMASKRLRRERANHTLQTTAIVNEVYLRLVKWDSVSWQNRAHFFAVAAQLMRNILVDYARKQLAGKRVNPQLKISFDALTEQINTKDVNLIALDDVLSSLALIDSQQSRIVELRFFAGLTLEETAEVMGLSIKTVRQEWETAKIWLLRELKRTV